ncbi:MAG: hypothetical protein LUH47_02330, partial [Clostridiales bacterium]|nr:hypothetical protein [Clostridiales bacterium]
MKKILLSKITKLIIFLLSAFCVFCAVFIFIYIDNTGYRLHETEYEKSYAFSSEIQACLNIIDNAVYEKTYSQKASILKTADENKIKYYINQDGEELTNFKTSPEDYRNFTLYYIYDRAAETAENNAYSLGGETHFADSEYFSYIYQTNGLDNLFLGFDINGFSEEKSLWQKEKNNVNGFICTLPVLAVLFILCLIYLTVTAGRKGDTGKIKLNFIDKIPAEIIIAAAFFIFSVSLGLFVLIWDMLYYAGLSVNEVGYLSGTETAAAYALILFLWLSLVKSVKTKNFLNRFLIFRILKGFLKAVKEFEGCCVSIAEYKLGGLAAYIPKLGVILGIALFFLGIACEEWEIWLAEIPLIFFFLLLSRFSKFLSQTDIIKKGIDEIKRGNTDYKTEGVEILYLKEMADNLNEIGNGLTLSLESALKSERMKTELVTNVSHDLKTPLTSIINFSELLCGEELT